MEVAEVAHQRREEVREQRSPRARVQHHGGTVAFKRLTLRLSFESVTVTQPLNLEP
jgi:hypothetical protein